MIDQQQLKEFALRIWDGTVEMFQAVDAQGHGSVILVFIIGMVFGSIIQYTKVHKFEKIAGFAMLKDTVVPKMLFLAIGLASIGLYYMIEAGYASYHIKTINLFGIIVGGIIFGIAMAIFGKCPGTGPISVAEGRIDIMVGSIGGILGGLVFTLYYDYFKMIMRPDLGKLSVIHDFNFGDSPKTILIFGGAIILVSILIPLREEVDEKDPAYKDMIQKQDNEEHEEQEEHEDATDIAEEDVIALPQKLHVKENDSHTPVDKEEEKNPTKEIEPQEETLQESSSNESTETQTPATQENSSHQDQEEIQKTQEDKAK
jgi:hypothetical protein